MAAVTTELKVLVKAVGKGEVDKLSKSLTDLGKRAVEPANKQFRQLSVELKSIQKNSTQSIANLKGYRNAWREISEQVEIGSREFKVATRNVERLDEQLKKVQARQAKGGPLGRIGGLRGAAKGVGAIAAGGVFGGAEGAAGAGIGLAVGGPAGAAVGAAIGAQVGSIRQALGATAEYTANLDKLRIALKGVTTSSEEYQDGLGFVQESTERFAIPQEILTRQFTKLQASVQGAGGNIEDTKTAFNGIVAAVRATGGSLGDVDAALTATAQVFSKGKVSAEELRQQIGERLPGAFTLFAESMGLTPAELDKALEQGKVSLQDFQGFAEAIFERYGKNAEQIAKSPKSAGDQLKVQLEQLNESVGRLLQPIGAFFQQTFAAIVGYITDATNALTRFLNLAFDEDKLAKAQATVARETERLSDPNLTGAGRTRAEARLRKARQAVSTQERLRDAGDVDVEQPGAGTGLPGIDLDSGAGEKIKEISADLLAKQKELLEANLSGDKVAAARLRKEARLLEIDGMKIGPNLRALEIAKAENQEAAALQRIEEQEEKRKQRLAQLQISFNAKLDEAKLKLGLITEEEKLANDQNRLRNALMIQFKDLLVGTPEEIERMKQAIEDMVEALGKTTNRADDLKKAFKDKVKNVLDLENNIRERLQGAVFELGDAFADFVVTGKASFADFTRSVLNDLAKILARFAIMQTLKAFIPGGSALGSFLGFADGGVFAKNKVVPFAYGGVVNKPTLFPMANGMGLMGEQGAEAIMPLRRNSSGRLGVEAAGGGSTTVNVSVDASGSQVQGDSAQAAQLGKAIGVAVQTEILKQKRPGGLLATT